MMDVEQRQFRADPLKLKRLRITAGMTVEEFCGTSGLDKTTARKVLKGEPVFLKTLAIAGEVFGVKNPLELLHPDELGALGVAPQGDSSRQVLEWEIVEFLTEWEKAANGLQYQVVKLRHRFLPGRWAQSVCLSASIRCFLRRAESKPSFRSSKRPMVSRLCDGLRRHLGLPGLGPRR